MPTSLPQAAEDGNEGTVNRITSIHAAYAATLFALVWVGLGTRGRSPTPCMGIVVLHPPQPTVFVLAGRADDVTREPHLRNVAAKLRDHGFAVVSMDLPCHGSDERPNEPSELDGWRVRSDAREPFVENFVRRATIELSDLMRDGSVDPRRVCALGISRGGFLALHWAARDRRVQAVAAIAPVTELARLTEFRGAHDASRYDVRHLRLADRARLWVGEADDRVGEDACASAARDLGVTLTVERGLRAHETTENESLQAAEWLLRKSEP